MRAVSLFIILISANCCKTTLPIGGNQDFENQFIDIDITIPVSINNWSIVSNETGNLIIIDSVYTVYEIDSRSGKTIRLFDHAVDFEEFVRFSLNNKKDIDYALNNKEAAYIANYKPVDIRHLFLKGDTLYITAGINFVTIYEILPGIDTTAELERHVMVSEIDLNNGTKRIFAVEKQNDKIIVDDLIDVQGNLYLFRNHKLGVGTGWDGTVYDSDRYPFFGNYLLRGDSLCFDTTIADLPDYSINQSHYYSYSRIIEMGGIPKGYYFKAIPIIHLDGQYYNIWPELVGFFDTVGVFNDTLFYHLDIIVEDGYMKVLWKYNGHVVFSVLDMAESENQHYEITERFLGNEWPTILAYIRNDTIIRPIIDSITYNLTKIRLIPVSR